MSDSETVLLQIADLSTDGRGVAHHNGHAYFVARTLPGDIVQARLDTVTRPFSARVMKVLSRSPHRCSHPCPHAEVCPGSQWGGLAYAEQLRHKRSLVDRTLAKQLKPVAVNPMVPSPKLWHYRSRISLTLWTHESRMEIGFQIGARATVGIPIRTCRLCVESVDRALPTVADFFRSTRLSSRIAPPRRMQLYESAVGAGMMLVFPKSLTKSEVDVWANVARDLALPGGTWLAVGTAAGVIHQKSEFFRIEPAAFMSTTWLGQSVELHPSVFCQANASAAELVGKKLRALAGEHRWSQVWDLYGGFGGLGIAAASGDVPIVILEQTTRAEPATRALASALNLNQVSFAAGDLLQRFPSRIRDIGSNDVVILDPPRSGTHPRIIEAIGRSRASSVIYLSCNPARLARDVALLQPHGFRPVFIEPVDFFPQTPAIETLALLVR